MGSLISSKRDKPTAELTEIQIEETSDGQYQPFIALPINGMHGNGFGLTVLIKHMYVFQYSEENYSWVCIM